MILGALVAVVNQATLPSNRHIDCMSLILIHQNERRRAGPHRDISWDIHPFCEGLPSYMGQGRPQSPDLAPSGTLIPPSLHSHTAVSISSCNFTPTRGQAQRVVMVHVFLCVFIC